GKLQLSCAAKIEHPGFAFARHSLGCRIAQQLTARDEPPRRSFATKRVEFGLSVHRANLLAPVPIILWDKTHRIYCFSPKPLPRSPVRLIESTPKKAANPRADRSGAPTPA